MSGQPETKKPPVAEPLLPTAWELPQEFRERMGDEAGRQRVMESDGHLLLVLHAPPTPGQLIRFGKTFWRDAAGQWKPVAMAHANHPIGELLDQYDTTIDKLETAADDAHSARDYFDILTALNPLLRACHNLYTVLQEARKLAKGDRSLILLRDRAYALNRRAELLQQDAKNTLDFVIARRAEEQADAARVQAKAAHRLNMLAALFFPVLTAASLLSTGLEPGVGFLKAWFAPWSQLAVLFGGLAIGWLLAAYVTRK